MTIQTQSVMGKLLTFLDKLDEERIWRRMEHFRETVMGEIAVPGERWEVEFFEDGSIEIERFISDGEVKPIELQEVTDLVLSYFADDEDE